MQDSSQQNECMILDDIQLDSLSQRLQWRNKDSRNIQVLFQEAKGKRSFPSAFQTFKSEGNFPFYKPEKKVQQVSVESSVETSQVLIDLSENFITAEGIQLLKMPELKIVDLEPLPDPDSDSNYPYAPRTPPHSLPPLALPLPLLSLIQ